MTSSISPDILISLAQSYGLPLFVYDTHVIDRQIHTLRKVFDVPHLEIRYASKAQNTTSILRHIYNQGCGIDTVSPGEITMALKAGIPPSVISFTPSGVITDEYAFAIERGVHVHADQPHILEWLDQHYPGTAITLRFNPGVRAGGHAKLQVGAEGSKFGILAEQVKEIVALTKRLSLKITGVHMHLGSDISDSGSFDEAYEYLLSIAQLWSSTLDHVDLGGGFKIPYLPDDHGIDMESFGARVSERFKRFCSDIGKDVTLVFEPGKFLLSEAGYLLMEVTSVRNAGNVPMVYVQSGFNHFLRPMSYGAYHHLLNISNPSGENQFYDVVGYLCETDTFALNRPINEIRKGDVLCLMNAGAYGYSMSSNYNGRPRPAEVMFKDGQATLIRRAETIDDLLRTDLGVSSET
ncbi:MAG TPA: diaminopimelate decarboxylase [Saprospiraceae bacterium]|nr:diaminopimelate decarboxylase [Saprospiraceae bacterium]